MIITPILVRFRKYRKVYRTLYVVGGPNFIVFVQLTECHETREEQCVIQTRRSQCFEVTGLGDISMVAMITAGMASELAPSSIVLRHYAVVIALEYGVSKFQEISREGGTERVARQLLDFVVWL